MFDSINLAIASLPIGLLISAIPHWYSIGLAEKHKINGGWTNQNPRAFVARLNAKAAMGKSLSAVEEKILRGQAAQQNGFEWWPVWAAAVILGNLAKEEKEAMDRYTIIYLASRIVYNYLYLITGTRRSSYLRTAVFQLSLYPCIAIIWRAAKSLS